ncbi:hypothetical protein MVEN_01602400 [Mycena venus]|uniref:DUF6535 domain-containing protein n=1 Tax=Mycena venus TaxID=2733690 RepID=A0A8H6XRF9_9AGAR|nr:hypothetical protein MVEN_01602400 [Mycena venus]
MSANISVSFVQPSKSSILVTTEDDDTKAAKEAIEPSQAVDTPRASMDLWSLYLEEANERAKAKADLWNGSLSAFLLFAGLFAGVVSSFVIDSRAGLQPDQAGLQSNGTGTDNAGTGVPATTVAINYLWFTSLTFTLISALAAVLAQTWIVKFSLVPTKGFKGAMERWIHDDNAEHWHLYSAITWITVLIQLALFLFLAGFAVQAVGDHKNLGWTIVSFVGATVVLYIGITILPWLYPTSPFRTPFSELSARNQKIFFSDALTAVTVAKNRTMDIWKLVQYIWGKLSGTTGTDGSIDSMAGAKARTMDTVTWAKAHAIDVWDLIQLLWHNLGKTPEESEVRLGICWFILKNSSQNDSIRAAVTELTKTRINKQQCQRLIEYGFPGELSNRLAHLTGNLTGVDPMRNYLHVIMWMVDGCDLEVAQGFSPLLSGDNALLRSLDALPEVCRALAFAVRVHLLVNLRVPGKTHSTQWTVMIDSLEPDFALDVFRAATRGLGIGTAGVADVDPELFHLRQDCARMIAAYVGSARFSNAKLATSRIAGKNDTHIPRAHRVQQYPVVNIVLFFTQLGKCFITSCRVSVQFEWNS